jgi:arylsulfatase A-like enzyme
MKKYIILTLLTALFASCNQTQTQTQKTEKPNVVIIFIDDEGYGDVGCYGATGFETPNLDHMASKGMRFTNYYSAQSVCSVSRAGLLTGCYPNRLGVPGALFPQDTIGLNSKEFKPIVS